MKHEICVPWNILYPNRISQGMLICHLYTQIRNKVYSKSHVVQFDCNQSFLPSTRVFPGKNKPAHRYLGCFLKKGV